MLQTRLKLSRKICMVRERGVLLWLGCPGVWEEMWLLDILEVYGESTSKGHHKKEQENLHG
jgi:hypothetical protein